MAVDTNIVTLTTGSYNQIKSTNVKLEMLLENLLLNASMSDDHSTLVFDSSKVSTAVQFCFPEQYKKKLSTLKTQYARYGHAGVPSGLLDSQTNLEEGVANESSISD